MNAPLLSSLVPFVSVLRSWAFALLLSHPYSCGPISPIMEAIKQTFAKAKQARRAALVAYVTAGYPTAEETIDIMLGMENGGAGTQLIPDAPAPRQLTPHFRLVPLVLRSHANDSY